MMRNFSGYSLRSQPDGGGTGDAEGFKGQVINGRMTFAYADREEIFEAGDAFYTPPGHVQVGTVPGTDVVLFSPAEELRTTDSVMMKNLGAMEGG